ncbi:hypothetical protein ABB37_04643 [Leptomonas pyrrhocoris]|uniref:Transmembrane protein n=1 Tax=Leptomonas pyrrhocoris TaxID=157538 RepID=A0A0M9G1F6_LEPPY|nr:hypothetical protein ABB37_04643 [Leptomonas pyrrhocoris]XP_015658835.1 hypothetical protein ABB37_04643 [Leptomonas pyrrhocoris]KPA80395.1 hypothetical protein ABB37_04643 [Leptomonas pyrrhocoris]KPA80396.1 hypothetical protein ABB37_04643 [Leptomonas pyrrhocoris]|eukprot:XP_015658834.1 hypothetical protein ABB37_04643 [Leptomonas pyrrhocoris]
MSGGGGFGGGQSPGDVVKSTRDVTESVKAQFQAARKNPEKELGIPLEELNRRQQEARKPHTFVNKETARKFEVKSSARAQQIMNKGIDKYQREKRQKDLKLNMSVLRKAQVVLCAVAVGFFGWFAVTYLLPQYAAVQHRNRRMQMRYERAQHSLEGAADTGMGGRPADVAAIGPLVRVFRLEDDGDTEVKRPIQ